MATPGLIEKKCGFKYAANYLIAHAQVGPNFAAINGKFLRTYADEAGNYLFKVLDCGEIKMAPDSMHAERIEVRANLVGNPFSDTPVSNFLIEEAKENADLKRLNCRNQPLFVVGQNDKHGEFSDAHYSSAEPFVEFQEKSVFITPNAMKKIQDTWKFGYS